MSATTKLPATGAAWRETPLDGLAWELVDAHERGELTEDAVDQVVAELLRRRSRRVLELDPVPEPGPEPLSPALSHLYWAARLAETDFANQREAEALGVDEVAFR
jgi:hypothetical protein